MTIHMKATEQYFTEVLFAMFARYCLLTRLCEMPQVIATSVIQDSANIMPFEQKEMCFIFGQQMKNDHT